MKHNRGGFLVAILLLVIAVAVAGIVYYVLRITQTGPATATGGVEPTEASVKDGSYVIQRPFVLVTKTGAKLSENAQKFFDFALSAEAAQYITSAGAVPVNG